MNQQAMLRKIQKLQEEMTQTQQEIEETVFTASVNDIVTVEVMGNKHLIKVEVSEDFEVEGAEDFEMLSDMIVAACNQTYKEIEKVTEEKMKKYQSLLGGFGGMF